MDALKLKEPMVRLTIDLYATGEISVSGHDQQLVAYGMLEKARDIIRNYHEEKQRLVQPATVRQVNLG